MSLSDFNEEIPGDITRSEIAEAANTHDWGDPEITTTSGNYWCIAYNDDETCFELVIEPGINKLELNNIFIDTSESIEITEYSDFEFIRDVIESCSEMNITLHTSGIEWQKVITLKENITDENGIPHRNIYTKLREEGVTVNATVQYTNTTKNTSINDVIKVINELESLTNKY